MVNQPPIRYRYGEIMRTFGGLRLHVQPRTQLQQRARQRNELMNRFVLILLLRFTGAVDRETVHCDRL